MCNTESGAGTERGGGKGIPTVSFGFRLFFSRYSSLLDSFTTGDAQSLEFASRALALSDSDVSGAGQESESSSSPGPSSPPRVQTGASSDEPATVPVVHDPLSLPSSSPSCMRREDGAETAPVTVAPVTCEQNTTITLEHLKRMILAKWSVHHAEERFVQQEIRSTAAEGEAILQHVLDHAGSLHLIRQNELSMACFAAAKRSFKDECKEMPEGREYLECYITRRTTGCDRIRYVYRQPRDAQHTRSRYFTVDRCVRTFLLSVCVVSSFSPWLEQEWKEVSTEQLLAVSDADLRNRREFDTLLSAIEYVYAFVAKFDPIVRGGNSVDGQDERDWEDLRAL
jgi:hypothetical protein